MPELLNGDVPDELVHSIRRAGTVAVDTETSGLDWRTDRLHMCQLFIGPVLLVGVSGLPTGLASLFCDRAGTESLALRTVRLPISRDSLGIRAQSVACAKSASKLVDLGVDDHNLKALLKRHLRLVVDKGTVRTSDWSAPC